MVHGKMVYVFYDICVNLGKLSICFVTFRIILSKYHFVMYQFVFVLDMLKLV